MKKLKNIFRLSMVFMLSSLAISAQTTNPAPYCQFDFSSSAPQVSGGIQNVALGTLNNSSTPGTTTSLYTYYDNLTPPILITGNSYTLNLTVNSATIGQPMYGAVYIDYNNDNVFQANEAIWTQAATPLPVNSPGGASQTLFGNVVIPVTAVADTVRMRVIRFEDNVPNSGITNFIPNYLVPACNVATGTVYNHFGEVEDYDVVIQAGALQPIVITAGASGVTITDATMNGDINMNATGTGTAEFEYGTTTAYGMTAAATPGTITGATLTPISAALTGLTASTTYHYRAKVTDGNGNIFYGNDISFVTNALPTPILNTLGATGVAQDVATLRGNANMNGVSGTGVLEFEYGTTTAYGTTVAGNPATITGTATSVFTSNLTGLTPNTTYHYRAILTEGGNVHVGLDTTFTTLPLPNPIIFTNAATDVLESSATLNGLANALNLGTAIVGFEYGTTTAYGSTIPGTPATITGSSLNNFDANISGLAAATTYHYRAYITVNGQTHYGLDQQFTTRDVTLPNISTASATDITYNSVKLNGFVNPQDYGTFALVFEYGTSTALGNTISATPAQLSGNQTVGVSATLNQTFAPHSIYYYRLVGYLNGTAYPGTILSFKIPPPLSVEDLEKSVVIFPNPSFGPLSLKSDSEIESILILNSLGQKILDENNIMSKEYFTMLDFPQGTYFINVVTKNGQYSQKLIKY